MGGAPSQRPHSPKGEELHAPSAAQTNPPEN